MVLAITAVTALTLGGTFAGVSYVFNRQQQKQLDAELIVVAREEAREAPSLNFAFTTRPGPAANDVGPLTKHGVIFDEHGVALASTPPFDVDRPARSILSKRHGECFDFTWAGQHLRAVVIPIPDHIGREVFLAAPRDDLDGDERFLNRAMAVAFVVALVWVVFVAYWGVGRLTRDHERIAQVARQVADGDFSARVASASTDAETLQLGRDIDEMIGTLEQLLAARDRLVVHAAHELRSPLTKLYGELQQALRKDRDAAGYRTAIERTLPAARRLSLLVDDLLLVAQLRGEQAALQPVELRHCIEEAIALTQEDAGTKRIEIRVEALDAVIDGRERDLTRLVRNLLDNAIAHAPIGSTVCLRLWVETTKVFLSVVDHGAGIEEEDRARMFDPFFRSAASRGHSARGAGLGLGIARDIARAHAGDVHLDPTSCAGKTRFVVVLPVATKPG